MLFEWKIWHFHDWMLCAVLFDLRFSSYPGQQLCWRIRLADVQWFIQHHPRSEFCVPNRVSEPICEVTIGNCPLNNNEFIENSGITCMNCGGIRTRWESNIRSGMGTKKVWLDGEIVNAWISQEQLFDNRFRLGTSKTPIRLELIVLRDHIPVKFVSRKGETAGVRWRSDKRSSFSE
jgi:hypothetical protein